MLSELRLGREGSDHLSGEEEGGECQLLCAGGVRVTGKQASSKAVGGYD